MLTFEKNDKVPAKSTVPARNLYIGSVFTFEPKEDADSIYIVVGKATKKTIPVLRVENGDWDECPYLTHVSATDEVYEQADVKIVLS